MHGLAGHVQDGLPYAWDLSLENFQGSYLCYQLALLHLMPYFLFPYRSSFTSLCTVFDAISSKTDEVLSINPSARVFAFGGFNAHHKDWLTCSSRTDGLPNTVIILLSQKVLLRWLTLILGSLTVTLIVLLFWIHFFILKLVFVLQWLSLY